MVGITYHFKKRKHVDLNNFEFVERPPVGVAPNGFPLLQEIDDPEFVQVPGEYSGHYKQVNDSDDFGFYTRILLRPGQRKHSFENLQVVVEQPAGDFETPLWQINFFAFRPCVYDPVTLTSTPLIDYFIFDQSTNMHDQHVNTELRTRVAGKALQQLIDSHAGPDRIDLAAGGTYKRHPIADYAQVFPMATKTGFISGNGTNAPVFTIHEMPLELSNHYPDVANLPENICFELKVVFYFAKLLYQDVVGLPATGNEDDPVLTLLPADSIRSMGAIAQVQ